MDIKDNYIEAEDTKWVTLTTLRNEVQYLREENKTLARQLHLERYVKKSNANQKILDLRSYNFQTEQETQAIRNRIDAVDRQTESRNKIVKIRQKQIEDLHNSSKNIEDNIAGLNEETNSLRAQNEVQSSSINQAQVSLSELEVKLKNVVNLKEDEIVLEKHTADELKNAQLEWQKNTEKLKVINQVQGDVTSQSKHLHQQKLNVEKEIKSLRKEIADNIEKQNDLQNLQLEAENQKTMLQKEKNQNQKIHNKLIIALRKAPNENENSQTDDLKAGGIKVNFDTLNRDSDDESSLKLEQGEGDDATFPAGEMTKSTSKIISSYSCKNVNNGRKIEVQTLDRQSYVQLNIRIKK